MLSSEPLVFQQNLMRRHNSRVSSSTILNGTHSNSEFNQELSRSPKHGSEKLKLILPQRITQILPPVQVDNSGGQGKNNCFRTINRGYRKGNDIDSGSGWHSHSVKLPSTRYSSKESEIDLQIPTICISGDRRTSISSQLRFSRTFSTDSLDSLEKQCLKEFKRQRFLMEEHDDKSSPTDTPPATLFSPSSSTYPSLRNVGRSKTDPGGTENVTNLPQKCPFSGGLSFDASKLGVSVDSTTLKRSTPDLLDNVKPKTLKDIIGISSYQAKGLLQCWPNIYATGTSGNFACQLYSNLCQRNSKAKIILQKANGVAVFSQSGTDCTSMHVKLTLELIDTVIRNLDSNPTNIIAYLTEIGQSHKALKDEGMSIALWDDFGDAILDGVRKNDLVRRHKELRRAWLAIIAFITDNIKQGHTSFRSSPSSNDLNDQRKKETTDAL